MNETEIKELIEKAHQSLAFPGSRKFPGMKLIFAWPFSPKVFPASPFSSKYFECYRSHKVGNKSMDFFRPYPKLA
jgi:hypothetical protein